MVKKATGQVYGPYDLETLMAWIDKKSIQPSDEVSKVGGQWRTFATHPTFAAKFGPPSAPGLPPHAPPGGGDPLPGAPHSGSAGAILSGADLPGTGTSVGNAPATFSPEGFLDAGLESGRAGESAATHEVDLSSSGFLDSAKGGVPASSRIDFSSPGANPLSSVPSPPAMGASLSEASSAPASGASKSSPVSSFEVEHDMQPPSPSGDGAGGQETPAPSKKGGTRAKEKVKSRFDLPFDPRVVVGNIVGLVGIVAILVGTWYAVEQRWLTIPDSWIERAHKEIEPQLKKVSGKKPKKKAIGEVAFDEMIAELREHHPKAEGNSQLYYLRGREQFLRDTPSSRRRAKALLEQAVLFNPQNYLALAALAETYCSLDNISNQEKAVRLIDRALRLNPGNLEAKRAKAALDIVTGHIKEGRRSAQEILQEQGTDVESMYYIALADLKQTPPDYEDALKELNRAIELDPHFHRAYYQLGIVYRELRRYRDAESVLKRKLASDPNNARTRAELARLYEEVGLNREALKHYEAAARSAGTEEPDILFDLAVLLYQSQGNYSRAIKLLSSILAPNRRENLSLSGQKSAYTHLAAALRTKGRAKRAIEVVEKALAIDPNFAPGLFQKGLAYLDLGRAADASKALSHVASSTLPPDVEAAVHVYLGRAAYAQGKIRDAVDEFSTAADAYKPDLYALLSYGNALLAAAQEGEALQALSTGALRDPTYVQRRAIRTAYPHRYGDLSEMVPRLNAVLKTKFYRSEITSYLGMLYLQMNRRNLALQTFQKALSVSAGDAAALLNLAIMAYHQGNARQTLSLLERLNTNHPQVGQSYIYMGRALTDLGRYDRAEATLQRAMRYARDDAGLHDALGVLYVKKGEKEKARREFFKAVDLDEKYIPPRRHLYQAFPPAR